MDETAKRYNKVLDIINKRLIPDDDAKKARGEVFTPLNIVQEMLLGLRRSSGSVEIWGINEEGEYVDDDEKDRVGGLPLAILRDSETRWLDPSNGIGNFPVVAFYILDFQIGRHGKKELRGEDNREKRHKHIIQNMLCMIELKKGNVNASIKIFKLIAPDVIPNVCCADTLNMTDDKLMRVFGVNRFDVIMGNPPYNKGGIWSHTQKLDSKKREVLCINFIKKSFEWLKPHGFLAFITPLYWLKTNNEIHNEMLNKYIVWLKLWDNSQSKGMINADIPISLFVLKNEVNRNKKTDIISILKRRGLTTISTEYLNPAYTIPLAFHSIFNKLIAFIESRKLQLEYKTKTIESSGIQIKLPAHYTLEDRWAVDTYIQKEGLMVKKAIETHPDANKRKLIIANKSSFKGAFIDKGKLSLTGTDKRYILGDNLELLLKLLTFKISFMISHFTKYKQDYLDNEAFNYLPDIRKLGRPDITEDEFYKLIGLTLQEIGQIKNQVTKEVMVKHTSTKRVMKGGKTTRKRH